MIFVDDGGPGIEPSMREAIIKCGVRAHEVVAGSGLGLAIVRDVAESGARFRLKHLRWEAPVRA